MKKILLISLILLPSIIQAETSYYKNLVEKDGLFYKKGSDEPYSGSVKGSQIGLMVEGKREKEWKEFYPDGNIKREVTFKNGVQNGLGSSYFPDGKLLMRGNLINGLQDGVWEKFYPNGNVEVKLTFKSGNREGLKEAYDENGKIKAKEWCVKNFCTDITDQ